MSEKLMEYGLNEKKPMDGVNKMATGGAPKGGQMPKPCETSSAKKGGKSFKIK